MSGLDEKGLIEPCGGCGEADPAKRCLNCRHEFFPNRRASAPPAPDGLVERLQRLADYIDQMQTPLTIREEGDRAIYREAAATLSAQEAEIERLHAQAERMARMEAAVNFVARWAWRTDPPNANNKLSDTERLSCIKHHPTINKAAQPHIELAESEAARALSQEGS